jgi:hypothetical protein
LRVVPQKTGGGKLVKKVKVTVEKSTLDYHDDEPSTVVEDRARRGSLLLSSRRE